MGIVLSVFTATATAIGNQKMRPTTFAKLLCASKQIPTLEVTALQSKLPEFYIKRRVYKLKGKSSYRKYLVTKTGKMRKDSGVRTPQTPQQFLSGNWRSWNDAEYESNSPSGRWTVILSIGPRTYKEWSHEWQFIDHIRNKTTVFLDNDPWDPPFPMTWHRSLDLLYIYRRVGTSTDHGYLIYQLDPSTLQSTLIGSSNGRIFFDPTGEWMIWETWDTDLEPLGNINVHVRHIVAYNIIKRKKFAITDTDFTGEVSYKTKLLSSKVVSINRFRCWK